MMKTCIIALLIAAAFALNEVAPGKRTLVIMEKNEYKVTHSKFLKNLEAKGCELTIVKTSDSFEISKYGEFNYDNIVIMLASSKKQASLKNKEFRRFLDLHGNVFVMFADAPSDFVRNLAGYSGVEIDLDGSKVVDHFTAIQEQGNNDHTKFTTTNYPKNKYLVGDLASYTGSILYRGMGMRMDDNNVLAIRALAGDYATTSISSTGAAQRHSSSVVLVAAVQTRSNNRIVISGSLDMFSNSFYDQSYDNQIFGNALSLWAFKFSGFLRVSNIQHYKYDRATNSLQKEHEILVQKVQKPNLPTSHYGEPDVAGNNVVYRIKDELYYAVTMEEWTGEQWVKYLGEDVQVEFVMLDPYVRKTLSVANSELDVEEATHSTIIKVPDVYGIYKFRLFYQRHGLSLINEVNQVSIRPFKHDEYPRFILAAYPYYITAIIMMVAFVLYVAIFLFTAEKEKQE